MPITSKELREKRANLAAQAKAILDKAGAEERDLSAEEDAQFKAIHDECEKIRNRYELVERQEELDRDLAASQNHIDRRHAAASAVGAPNDAAFTATEQDRSLALQGWMRAQMKLRVSDLHKEAAKKCRVNLRGESFGVKMLASHEHRQFRFRNAQGVTTPSAGGFTVPEGFVANLERAMLQFGGMLGVADVMRTDTGQELLWPTVNDTSNSGELIGENTAQNSQDVTFGAKAFHAYKYSSKLILVSVELLEDSAFDLAAQIGSIAGERLGRIQNLHWTTGDGSAKPEGIVTGATSGVTAASATAFTCDELYALKHSVDPAYRAGAMWMMKDATLLALKKLKDGMGRYLWQAGTAMGAPDTYDGDPIVINQDMASVATGTKPIVYGQLSKYKIRQVREIRLRRLVERYAEYDQEGFVAFVRCDGALLDAGTHPVKFITMA